MVNLLLSQIIFTQFVYNSCYLSFFRLYWFLFFLKILWQYFINRKLIVFYERPNVSLTLIMHLVVTAIHRISGLPLFSNGSSFQLMVLKCLWTTCSSKIISGWKSRNIKYKIDLSMHHVVLLQEKSAWRDIWTWWMNLKWILRCNNTDLILVGVCLRRSSPFFLCSIYLTNSSTPEGVRMRKGAHRVVFGSNGEGGKWLMGKKIGIYVTLLVSDSTKAFPHIGPGELYPYRKWVHEGVSRLLCRTENRNRVWEFLGMKMMNYISNTIQSLL